jgi:hypothetical protein
MPRQTREQRREEQDRKGRAWAQWLAPAMAQASIDVKTLVERARREGATFDKTNVSRWLNGEKNAEPAHAAIVARILGRDPDEALRAAGHDALANAYMHPTEAELRARIADLESQIDAGLDHLGAAPRGGGNEEDGDGDRGAS